MLVLSNEVKTLLQKVILVHVCVWIIAGVSDKLPDSCSKFPCIHLWMIRRIWHCIKSLLRPYSTPLQLLCCHSHAFSLRIILTEKTVFCNSSSFTVLLCYLSSSKRKAWMGLKPWPPRCWHHRGQGSFFHYKAKSAKIIYLKIVSIHSSYEISSIWLCLS